MTGYIVRRLLTVVPMLLIISVIVFTMTRMVPGDPVMLYLGSPSEAVGFRPEFIEQTRHDLGFDKPLVLQYFSWLGRTLHGDLGRSTQTREDVRQSITDAVPKTAYLALLSLLVAIAVGVPAGIISAMRRNSPLDVGVTLFATMGIAVPHFFLGILLILFLGVYLGWLPTFGYKDPLQDPIGNLRYMILPALTLGLGLCASIMRYLRSSMLNVLSADYIRTARAKGLPQRAVLVRHAVRNALIPVVTVIGLQIAHLLSGAVIIETVFGIPGLGRLAVQAVMQNDYNVVLGAMVLVVCIVVTVNLIVDLSYSFLDPRIRHSRG